MEKLYKTISLESLKNEMLGKLTAKSIAEEICSVQPMGPEVYSAIGAIYEGSKSREELIKEGYEPVCPTTGLMWIKKND